MQTFIEKDLPGTSVGPLSRYLQAGLIAGLVAAVLANAYYLIYQAAGGASFAELNIFTITFTSLLTSVVGSGIYYLLARKTGNATNIFVGLGLAFTVFSLLPVLVAPLYPGFGLAAGPMHVIVGLTVLAIITWRVRNQQ